MCGVCALAYILAGAAPAGAYDVYQPSIERSVVCDGRTSPLAYNHDSSIAHFGDRWYCLWNAHPEPFEGRPGQLNYQSTSPDGSSWSPPVPAFAAAEQAENPVPCPTGTQWQPNLLVVGGELWALWTQHSRDEHRGVYLSRLRQPGGRWVNERILFAGQPDPILEGRPFRVFASQNPCRLRSGRILAPVVLSDDSRPAADAPVDLTGWWVREKRDSVLYTDDLGRTWHCSPGTVQPGRRWAQWEPTVWETPDGDVLMVARNNDPRPASQGGVRPSRMLLSSVSHDGGETWSPHDYVPLETVSSRMHVLPLGGDRYVMAHNDWPAGQFVADRRNLALFFTRGRGFDFVAGPGFTGDEPVVAYPQMAIYDDALLVSYSQGNSPRSIKVARIHPLPRPERWYLFPRTNVPPSPRPSHGDGGWVFFGEQRIETREPLDPGRSGFSLGAWVSASGSGVLLDNRTTRPPGGFLWGLTGLRPYLWLGTPEHNLTATLALPPERWTYVGATVDPAAGVVTFFVGDETASLTFSDPIQPFAGDTAYVGAKRFEASRVPGFEGTLRALAVLPSARLDQAGHGELAARLAPDLAGRTFPGPLPWPTALWLDGAVADPGPRFTLPSEEPGHEGVRVTDEDGVRWVEITGEASVGVDLADNERSRGDRVEFSAHLRIETATTVVLATVGDADNPARVVAESGSAWIEQGTERAPLGPWNAGEALELWLSSGEGFTRARVRDREAVIPHRAAGTWLYLGNGYRTGRVAPAARFAVRLDTVSTRVHPGSVPTEPRPEGRP